MTATVRGQSLFIYNNEFPMTHSVQRTLAAVRLPIVIINGFLLPTAPVARRVS